MPPIGRKQFSGTIGAVTVAAGAVYLAPAGQEIYYVVPNGSFGGKALAPNNNFSSVSADGTNTGADFGSALLSPFYGHYASVSVTSGSCFAYICGAGQDI